MTKGTIHNLSLDDRQRRSLLRLANYLEHLLDNTWHDVDHATVKHIQEQLNPNNKPIEDLPHTNFI